MKWKNKGKFIEIEGDWETNRQIAIRLRNKFKTSTIPIPHLVFELYLTDYIKPKKVNYHHIEIITLPSFEFFTQYPNPAVGFQLSTEKWLNSFISGLNKKYGNLFNLNKKERKEKKKEVEDTLLNSFLELFKQTQNKTLPLTIVVDFYLNTGEIFNLLLVPNKELGDNLLKILKEKNIKKLADVEDKEEFLNFIVNSGVYIADQIYSQYSQ